MSTIKSGNHSTGNSRISVNKEIFVKEKLWKELQGTKFRNYNFEKDKQLGAITIDFYCDKMQFAIVVDSDSDRPEDNSKVDSESQAEMEQMGVIFLRFKEGEIRKNMGIVLRTIGYWLKDRELRYL